MRNGQCSDFHLRCSNTNPTAWPTNWMRQRMARMARITEKRSKNKQTTMDVAPSASSATCGNRFVGCTFANTEKKFPSSAAAYGTREYPSVAEKTDPNASTRISAVASVAQFIPNVRSTNKLTTKLERCTSCHGTTLKMLVCIRKYKIAIPNIEINIARGIFFPGSFISPPRLHTL